MSDSDLLFMPAVKAAALIRSRKLSPVEYVDTVLKVIDRAQPRLNCFRVVMAEEARRDARAAEKAVTDGAPLGGGRLAQLGGTQPALEVSPRRRPA